MVLCIACDEHRRSPEILDSDQEARDLIRPIFWVPASTVEVYLAWCGMCRAHLRHAYPRGKTPANDGELSFLYAEGELPRSAE